MRPIDIYTAQAWPREGAFHCCLQTEATAINLRINLLGGGLSGLGLKDKFAFYNILQTYPGCNILQMTGDPLK